MFLPPACALDGYDPQELSPPHRALPPAPARIARPGPLTAGLYDEAVPRGAGARGDEEDHRAVRADRAAAGKLVHWDGPELSVV